MSEKHKFQESKKLYYSRLSLGIVLFIASFFIKYPVIFIIPSYILIGIDVLHESYINIKKGKIFDENFLMSIATIGALVIREFPEAVAVMLFYKIGEYFEELAVGKSKKSVTKLLADMPNKANVLRNNKVYVVEPESVEIGEILVIKVGEKVPIDGVIIEGNSSFDTSSLTGESLPKDLGKDDEILSGYINLSGVIKIKTTKTASNSTISKILELVQNAENKKAKLDSFISRFAKFYTPIVIALAITLAVVPLFFGGNWTTWLYRALVFLVVSCPCALVISIPLTYFAGIGGASHNGVLVKGSSFLDALTEMDTVVFDKTGTLTKGVLKLDKIVPINYTENELLHIAASCEANSNHPIAKALLNAYTGELSDAKKVREIAGKGIKAEINGAKVAVGNSKLLDKVSFEETTATAIYVSVDGKYAGYITFTDEIKENAFFIGQALKKVGINKTVMLTGDNVLEAAKVATRLNINKFYATLLPQDKLRKFEEIKGKKVFVGDGINDAPVMASADVSIGMGKSGSDIAIESSDIVIMGDEISKVPLAIKFAKKTKKIAYENVTFALGIKAIILILGTLGLADMWWAVFGDVGVTVLAILNATRARKVK